jgi:8-oxo-dGTP pyrophosphatase MutT (NUDIX family)
VAGGVEEAEEASAQGSIVIRGSGGLVVREGDGGEREVLVVHRPRYDDWSFPKGKLKPEESDEECALREVAEETGLVCELGEELASSEYEDASGRPKRVRYWLMRPVGGRLEFHHEVDDARWVSLEDARRLLSYARDRGLLEKSALDSRGAEL